MERPIDDFKIIIIAAQNVACDVLVEYLLRDSFFNGKMEVLRLNSDFHRRRYPAKLKETCLFSIIELELEKGYESQIIKNEDFEYYKSCLDALHLATEKLQNYHNGDPESLKSLHKAVNMARTRVNRAYTKTAQRVILKFAKVVVTTPAVMFDQFNAGNNIPNKLIILDEASCLQNADVALAATKVNPVFGKLLFVGDEYQLGKSSVRVLLES